MTEVRLYKNFKKQKDRESTIKHYLLGYLLECTERKNVDFTVMISDFIVKKLKVIDEATFDKCLFKLVFSEILVNSNTRQNYRRIKLQMKLNLCDLEEQITVINNLKCYSDTCKDGKYLKPRMIESSYL